MPRVSILALFTVALLLSSTHPAHGQPGAGGPCTNTGQSVAPDPQSDVTDPELDIRDVAIAELFSGPHAGRVMFTLQLRQLGSPMPSRSALWTLSWKGSGGQNTTTLTLSNCNGNLVYQYDYETQDGGSQIGAPDDGAILADGRIRFILSRDKFGDPPAGALLTDIRALAEPFNSVPPAGCLPGLTGQDVSDQSGTYTMGSCVLAAPPLANPSALRLGPPLPNPARAGVRWTLEVPASLVGRDAAIHVLDASGRRVRTLHSGPLAAAPVRLEWDLRSQSGARVPPGSYWISARVGDEVRSERVQVLR